LVLGAVRPGRAKSGNSALFAASRECSLQFVNAGSAATLPMQQKMDLADKQRGRVDRLHLNK
jgi:hypothetical protein